MKKTTAFFAALILMLTFSSCTFNITNNFSIDKTKSFILEISNQCDCTIYGYHYEYCLNGKPIGGGTVTNADESFLDKKEKLKVSFTEYNFPADANLSDFQIEFYILNEDFSESEASNMLDLPAEYGKKYKVSVSGSFNDGIKAEQQKK